MELADGLKKRRVIRHYTDKAVEKEKIEKIFELARWSPVADFFKIWKFIVLTGEKRDKITSLISKNTSFLRDLLMQIDETSRQKALNFYPDLGNAPVLILVVIPAIESQWDRRYLILAAGTEIQNFLLAAFDEGLGACGVTIAPWVEEKIKEELGLKDCEVLCGLTLGYPAEEPAATPHKKADVDYL